MSSESSETFIGNENASHPEQEKTKNEKDESQNARKHSAEAESFTSGSHNAQKHGEQARTTEDKSQNSWTHREQSKNAKGRSQNTDKHECKNQRSSEYTFTLPIFCDNLEDKLLTNGCRTLSFLQIKSIDPYIPREELRKIKAVRPDFHKGWLYDEVINSFFWMLTIENENVLYIESSFILVYSKVRKTSLRLLWKGENIADKLFVIVPWNVNENHWTFIVADIRNKEIIFIDPMEDQQETSVTTALQPYVALSWVLNTKLGSEFNWKLTFPSHALQQDAISCGVFVCWYAYQMILKSNVE